MGKKRGATKVKNKTASALQQACDRHDALVRKLNLEIAALREEKRVLENNLRESQFVMETIRSNLVSTASIIDTFNLKREMDGVRKTAAFGTTRE
jgi:hypothetical protein